MWVYWPDRDDVLCDDEPDTSDPRVAKALDMIQEWEMNHWKSRKDRCDIIAKANSILSWITREWYWREDYRD